MSSYIFEVSIGGTEDALRAGLSATQQVLDGNNEPLHCTFEAQ
jgi:hypothetical protein